MGAGWELGVKLCCWVVGMGVKSCWLLVVGSWLLGVKSCCWL
jgi:hypothetical protein